MQTEADHGQPDKAYEAYCNFMDYAEAAHEVTMTFEAWKAQCAQRREEQRLAEHFRRRDAWLATRDFPDDYDFAS